MWGGQWGGTGYMTATASRGACVDSLRVSDVAPVTLRHRLGTGISSALDQQPAVTIPAVISKHSMDFSKFRDTGELSDIAVVVEGQEFKLHKFPLYIKSDFFRALARSSTRGGGEKDRVELSEFPGGVETFDEVANYCYNVKVNINKDNVCRLRCAAEFLQMNSPGNLAALTDRFLQDTLTSAKLGHRFETIIDLVLQCRSLGAIAEQAGVVDKCIKAIVDCWLISTKFTCRRYTSDPHPLLHSPLPHTEKDTIEKLCEFPLHWYKQLCIVARDKSVKPALFAALVQAFISDAVDRKNGKKKRKTSVEPNKEEEQEPAEDLQTERTDEDHKEDEEGTERELEQNEQGETDPAEIEEKPRETEETEEEEDSEGNDDEELDIGEIMDALLPQVPTDHPMITESFSRKWVAQMLRIAAALRCESQEVLLKLSGKMLHRFSKEDLSDLSPEILSQIVAEGCRDTQTDPDDVCRILDDYLMDQADKENLTVDTFQTLVDAVPKDSRASHDMLFQVLETLLTSERLPVEEEKKQELLNTVDYGRLSESTLQRAYDSGLVPGAYVTRAALALCTKLRGDLDAAKVIIKEQEQRLERYGLAPGAGASWLRSVESEYETSYEPSRVRGGGRGGATPTLATDLELKMALGSLDRTVESMGMTDAAPTPSMHNLNYSSYYGDDGGDSYQQSNKPYTSTYTWSSRPYSKYSKT